MSHELDYTSQPLKKEITIKTTGEIVIELQNDRMIKGHVPLTKPIPYVLTNAEAYMIKDEITLKLAEVKHWDIRRLLSKPFEDGDQKLQFAYILNNTVLSVAIEVGPFTPVYLKHLNTSDLRG